ncbi:MAG TPA: mechanosensitive ion channel family protein, partial [Flavobacteriaceae bacterium]|nr:mechanosensitive ion channel family protein [Flavobacteriaceae bacterium]
IVFVFFGKFIKNICRKLFRKITDNEGLRKLAATFVYVVVVCVGAFIALSVLNLDGTVTSLLAGAGIVGLALAFAFQEIASNYMAGTMMSIQKPFKVGDLIESNDYFGKVLHIHLRTTEMMTLQGQIVLIPNADVFKKPIVNYSKSGRRRVDLKVGVSYSQDLALAKEVALKAIKNIEGIKEEEVTLFYEEFDDSSINFSIRYWMPFTNKNFEYKAKVDEGVMAIKAAFDQAGINIPFPIRTLDFGSSDLKKTLGSEPAKRE